MNHIRSPCRAPGDHILIHTDGSCLGNPGPGGFAAVLRKIDSTGNVAARKAVTGGEGLTTNNRMELRAAIAGLGALKRSVLPVVVVTDSQYVRRGLTEWLPTWKVSGRRTSARKPVQNADLWKELEAVAAGQLVTWAWVKGHSGDPWNEEANTYAQHSAAQIRVPLAHTRATTT